MLDQRSRFAAVVAALPRLGPFIALGVFAVAAWFLREELHALDFATLQANLRTHSRYQIALAALCTIGSYLLLTGYDALALRYVQRRLTYARTALTSFMAYAVGHNVGVAALSGGAIRYHMYSRLGLSTTDIARVIAFCTITFIVGAACLIGIALLLIEPTGLVPLALPLPWVRAGGAVLLASAIGYVVLPLLRRAPITLANWRIELPGIGTTSAQLVVSMGDLLFASTTLYVLLPSDAGIGYLTFLGVYLIAIAAGIVSSIPGGLGVFEAVLLIAIPGVPSDSLLSTIILYRLVYYVAPLTIALTFMAMHELAARRRIALRTASRILGGLSGIAPHVISISVFIAGVVLLVSGATPSVETRLALVSRWIPHPVLELSHLAGSTIGVVLVILAHGLFRRLERAYRVVMVLLVGGIAASLLKGLDYEEAVILSLALGLLWAGKQEFYRRGFLSEQRFSIAWMLVVLLALAGALWVGIASYRHIPYSNELWWQFSLDGDAPRMLRATLVTSVIAIVFAVSKLLRGGPRLGMALRPSGADWPAVRRVVASARDSSANAALIGDKRLLFNADSTGFVMYQVSGASWIALGDPVGPPEQRAALAWQFRELCDRHGAWPSFYQVTDESLPIYIDMGLTLAKLGEDARVPLHEFSLEGSARASLRQEHRRGLRSGASFAVLAREEVRALLPELEAVSNAWLAGKASAEKGFSLGRFSADYLVNFDCAVVRVNGAIVAFANLWPAPAGGEVSIDLMRYNAAAPKGIMDYLFVELLLWAKAQGFAWFSLGMAPLSGLEHHPLAPVWHKFGNLLFRHGEDFYNFEGLRAYKEKFAPVWRPRYLACHGGLALPRVLLDSAALISGGFTKVLSR